MYKRLIFSFILLSFCTINSAAQASRSPRETVALYLKALKALDHTTMDRYWAETVTRRSPDGAENRLDKDFIRNMRDFERGVNTVWKYKIKKVEGERVTVDLSEKNDFYDLLGVGTRFITNVYYVRDGRIYLMDNGAARHSSSDDYDGVYAAFKKWLMESEAKHDKQLVGVGVLIWDAESAKRMRPWLKIWNKDQRKKRK